MVSLDDIDQIDAAAPLSVQLDGGRLLLSLDEANAIDAKITAVVPSVTDSAGVVRTAYRWTKQQPMPGGTFADDDGNIRGYVASDTPPTWPAFCTDEDFPASVGDMVRLYPGHRDDRTDLTVNYGIDWFFRASMVAFELTVSDYSNSVLDVAFIQFLPQYAVMVQADGAHHAKVTLNPTHAGFPGIISTEPQFLGAGFKSVWELGIQTSAPLADPEIQANIGMVAPASAILGYDPFNPNPLLILSNWNTNADYLVNPLANVVAGPLLTLNTSAIAAWPVRFGCGGPTGPISTGKFELYSGSLVTPIMTLHNYSGTGGSYGSYGHGGGWSSFDLFLTGSGIQEQATIQGFVPGGQWLVNHGYQPWKAGPLFISDDAYGGTGGAVGSGLFISVPYKIEVGGSGAGPAPGTNILYRGYTGIVSGLGFASGVFVGGTLAFNVNYGNGSGSGGNGGGNGIGILSTTQGGTGLNLSNVGPGLLLVTGDHGAPMQVLSSVRTGANGKLQFGVDVDTWIEYDMSTYP